MYILYIHSDTIDMYDQHLNKVYINIIHTPLKVEAESSKREYLDFSVFRLPEKGTIIHAQ